MTAATAAAASTFTVTATTATATCTATAATAGLLLLQRGIFASRVVQSLGDVAEADR